MQLHKNVKKEHNFFTGKAEAVALSIGIILNFVDIETPVKILPAK
jgi:hypothetical protein